MRKIKIILFLLLLFCYLMAGGYAKADPTKGSNKENTTESNKISTKKESTKKMRPNLKILMKKLLQIVKMSLKKQMKL